MHYMEKEPFLIVKTCAASGNLGPGYDIIGLALNIFNTYEVFYSDDERYHVIFKDCSNPGLKIGEDNLIIKVLKRVLEKTNSGVKKKHKEN